MKLVFTHTDFAHSLGISHATWNHWLDAGSDTLQRWGLDLLPHVAPPAGEGLPFSYMEARLLAEYFGIPLPE